MHKFFKMILLISVTFFMVFGSFSYAETVKIIAEDDWYPYSGFRNNGAEGIAVDIVRETFKAEGIDVEFDVMGYDRGMLMVKDGEAIGCFNAPRTNEIEETYYWHDEPMFTSHSYFYARADYEGTVSKIDDLNGKKLGLTQGYGYGDVIDMNNTINKEYSKTEEIILKKLIYRRLDYIILYDRVADYLMSKNNVYGKIKQVGPSELTGLYVVFSKKHPDGKRYRDIFSAGFKKIKENGTYSEIFKKWDEKLKGKPSTDIAK
ncbi:MAG TPA: hypothetical protein DDX37_09160 [Candidatus Omnitrophica bacterium]|nr:hypothetical protein [Candidatus Omnitrophota bacterium]